MTSFTYRFNKFMYLIEIENIHMDGVNNFLFQYVPCVEDHVLGIVMDTKADVRTPHQLHLFGNYYLLFMFIFFSIFFFDIQINSDEKV